MSGLHGSLEEGDLIQICLSSLPHPWGTGMPDFYALVVDLGWAYEERLHDESPITERVATITFLTQEGSIETVSADELNRLPCNVLSRGVTMKV